jgi:iron(III) transport system ATP-binding protein
VRPEDVLARPFTAAGGDSTFAADDSNVFDAQIDKIEFLGSYCLVQVSADALGEHRLAVVLSPNFLAERRLEVGARLPLRLLPERMRIFGSAA